MNTPIEKTYLGDGVYADIDGVHMVLTTENGISTTNTIYLGAEELKALAKFMERAAEAINRG